MKKNSITIKDIAKELNVHHTTVSLALRNSKSIKRDTRDRVQQKANEMGYRPNRLAQGFRNKRSNTIGVLVPNIQHHFFSKFIAELSENANREGFSVMVFQSNEKLEIEKQNVDILIDNRVAGVIASISIETTNGEHFKAFREEGIPLVLFDRVLTDMDVTQVVADNFQGAYNAVTTMIDSERRRIAFITGANHINVYHDRLEGYMQALKENDIPFDPELLVNGNFYIEDGIAGAKKVMNLPNPPDAILAVGDAVGVGAIKYIKSMGIRIPEEISIIGFDNDPMGIAIEPELTTVKQPVSKMAELAFNLLLQQIKDNTITSIKKILKSQLLIRQSN